MEEKKESEKNNRTKNIYSFNILANKIKINKNNLNKFSMLKNKKLKRNSYRKNNIIYNNIQKYNSIPIKKNIMIINNIIESKENHYIAIFKDHLIYDFIYEFLRHFYNIKESKEKILKIYNYYRNYLKYFCKPIFCDFNLNEKFQDYGQKKQKYIIIKNMENKKKKSRNLKFQMKIYIKILNY